MFKKSKLNTLRLTAEDIDFINDLVLKAGDLSIQRYNEGQLNVTNKGEPDDLVTKADKELSKLLVKSLKKRFPYYGIISEEEQISNDLHNYDRWFVIDPIDGTDNYIRNDSNYSIMIGILSEGQPQAGWVYAPLHGNLYLGIPGDGIFIKRKNQEIAKVHTVLPTHADNMPVRLMMGRRDRKKNPEILEKLANYQLIEKGSLGVKVAAIIEHQADIFIHTMNKLKIWDTVAPSAIAIASKMHLSTLNNEPFNFSIDEIQHTQTYAVGTKWAFNTIRNLLNK